MVGVATQFPTLETISAYHVTSDPENVLRVLRTGGDISRTRAEGLVGDMGTSGLYFSDVPQLWVARATGKWDFLDTLTAEQKSRLLEALRADLREDAATHYIASFELETALRDIDYVDRGELHPKVLIGLAGQPYNIRFWEPEYLAELGIEQPSPPIVVPIRLRGRFADVSSARGDLSELMEELKAEGYDGAFIKGDIIRQQQGVVWNTGAVEQFGEYEAVMTHHTPGNPGPAEIVQRQYVTPAGTVVEFGIRQGDKVYLGQRTATVMGWVDEARRGWYPVSEQELANYKTWLGRRGKYGGRASEITYLERHADEVIRRGDEYLAKQEEEKQYYQQLEANRATAAARGYGVSRDDLQVGDEVEWAGDSSRWIVTEFDDEGVVYARPREEPTQGGGSLGRGFLQEYKLVKRAGNPGHNPGKEPWEMTYEELARSTAGDMPEPQRQKVGKLVWVDLQEAGWEPAMGTHYLPGAKIPTFRLSQAHRKAIRQALDEGKPVPPEVLADYPDLTAGNPNGHYWYMDIPRNAAAGATGVLTGLTGSAVVPLVGLTGGIILQLVEKDVPTVKRLEYWTEGVVDGSVALLAQKVFRG